MKLKLTAMATALLISISGAYADNTTTATIGMKAYVADGLSYADVKPLIFGDIVQPNTGTHSMTVDCATGDLSYGEATATPNGAAVGSGAANAELAFANGSVQAGSVVINGEAGYGITVSTSLSPSTPLPASVVFDPMLNVTNDAEGATINAVVGTGGAVTVNMCGTLTVGTDTPTENIELDTVVLISYR